MIADWQPRMAKEGRAGTLGTIAEGKAPSTGDYNSEPLHVRNFYLGGLSWILLPPSRHFS